MLGLTFPPTGAVGYPGKFTPAGQTAASPSDQPPFLGHALLRTWRFWGIGLRGSAVLGASPFRELPFYGHRKRQIERAGAGCPLLESA